MKPNYNRHYYLNIANTVFRIELSDQHFLYDHWHLFFHTFLKNFLCRPKKHDYLFRFTGPLMRDRKLTPPNPTISLPVFRGNICYFNHLLHPNFFLTSLKALLGKDLLKRKLLLLHAACVAFDNTKAVLIVGKPGDGKSTTLRKLVPPLLPLSDDMVIITKKSGKLFAFPCPFNTKQDLSQTPNQSIPITGVIFPVKGNRLSLIKASQTRSLLILLDQVFFPLKTRRGVEFALDLLRPLSTQSYLLSHRLKDDILGKVKNQFSDEILQTNKSGQ